MFINTYKSIYTDFILIPTPVELLYTSIVLLIVFSNNMKYKSLVNSHNKSVIAINKFITNTSVIKI